MNPPVVATTRNTVDTTLVTTAETIVAALGGVSTRDRNEPVTVEAAVWLTTGVGTTEVIVRVRRGAAITDPLVGEARPVDVAASADAFAAVRQVDFPGEVAGQVYIITVSQTAATGNGTATQVVATTTVGG